MQWKAKNLITRTSPSREDHTVVGFDVISFSGIDSISNGGSKQRQIDSSHSRQINHKNCDPGHETC